MAVAAGCLALAAACGSEKEDPNDPKIAAGCRADFALSDGFAKLFSETPALRSGKPPSKTQLSEIQANYDRYIGGPLAELHASRIDPISDDVEKLDEAAKTFRATGDPGPIESPAFKMTKTTIEGFYFDECSGEKADIAGIDYAFEGVKKTYDAGEIRIKFPNEGKELHELVLLKRNPDVKESFDELLELPEKELASKVELVAGEEAAPSEEAYVNADLTPGDYLMVCFLPEGSTPEKEGKGKPHFELGMKEELTVE